MTHTTNPITEARAASDRILKSVNNNFAVSMSDIAELCRILSLAETQAAEIERWKSAAAEWQETCENSQKYAQAIIAELKAENQRLKDSEEYTAGDCDEKQTQIDSLKAKLAKAEEVIAPFAKVAAIWPASVPGFQQIGHVNVTVDHCRAAHQFTKGEEG